MQAQICRAMGSAFSADLLERAAGDAAGGGPSAVLFEPWAQATRETLFADALALRWLGALHDLALGGEDAELTASYPGEGRPGDVERAWAAAGRLMGERRAELAAFMDHEPQTNEVRRSICLLGGFLMIAAATGLPLSTRELGASAGLNQLWDRYRHALGPGATWGVGASPVQLDTEWRGAFPPLQAPVSVLSRRACDRKPVDLRDRRARRRLRAYVWADQLERLARLDAAIEMAETAGVTVEAADALDFTMAQGAPRPGAATVIYHSVFWQYLPARTQEDLTTAIAALGEAASAAAPLAWLRMEPRMENLAEMEVRLTLWPSGEERRLARCHPHGAWVEWEA